VIPDLVIRDGRLVDEAGVTPGDVAIVDGRIAELGTGLAAGTTEIDAAGSYVMPGGVDCHVHMGQLSSLGDMTADDFRSGSRSAAYGGTTTVVPFAAQHRGMSIGAVFADALRRAEAEMAVDYGMHLIVTDLTGRARDELREVAAAGAAAVKIYLTYDRLKVAGAEAIELMRFASALGLPVMVHAEDDTLVTWGRDAMVAAGEFGAHSHTVSHSRAAEISGVAHAIGLAAAAGAKLYLAHISTPQSIDLVADARARGVDVAAETCPHYLLLDAAVYTEPIATSAPFMCSPPLRGRAEIAGMLDRLASAQVDLVASDHSPYTMSQKVPNGAATKFTEVANGLPGVELRLSILFTAAVASGRITMSDLVRLTAANPARICGIYPRKGSLEVGADADLVIWDETPWTVGWGDLHDNVGYTPYEGVELAGRPGVVISRGEVIVADTGGGVVAGRGRFVRRS
jgi:dihydropyrimidinase